MTQEIGAKNEAGLPPEDIKLLIGTCDEFAVKCLKVLYDKQTEDEKQTLSTHHYNDVGFNGADAEILSSFAKQVFIWEQGNTGYQKPLSPKQMALLQKKLPKYAKQLSKFLTKE